MHSSKLCAKCVHSPSASLLSLPVLASVATSRIQHLDLLAEAFSYVLMPTGPGPIRRVSSSLSALVQHGADVGSLLALGEAIDAIDALAEIVPLLATKLHGRTTSLLGLLCLFLLLGP